MAILSNCFLENCKKTISLLLFSFLLSHSAFAQVKVTVSGTVLNENNQPIPAASISSKDLSNGLTTDANGKFSISINDGATLVISHISYETQEIVINGGNTSLKINLVPKSGSLSDVVVIGYGTAKKSDLTGSVVRANLEAFRAQPNVSIVQSLQGTLPGLNVGAVNSSGGSPNISVRGRNTLSGTTAPLIVLDGIIYNGNMADLNPNDIESIDILKDASSKAIYGSQAANGVLLVTSKKGKKGRKPEVNYSTFYSLQSPANQLTPLNSQEFLQKTKDEFFEEAFLAPDYTQVNPAFDVRTKFTSQLAKDGIASGVDFNYLDLISQQGYINNHNLSISGANENLNYFLSGNYSKQQGFIKGDVYDRFSIRANFDNQIRDWLIIGIQSFVTSADYSGATSDRRAAYLIGPIYSPYNADGTLAEFPAASTIRNPLYPLLADDLDKRLNLFAKVYAVVDIPYIKGLTYTLNYSTNYRTVRQNRFDKYALNNSGAGYKNNDLDQDYTIDNILSYNRTFANDHRISATALYGTQRLWGNGTDASGAIFLNNALGYNSLESGDIAQRGVGSSAYKENSLYQMGRLFYGYKSKYLFTGTVRRDGFSGFGSNRKFGIFPSASVAWVASEEDFIANALPVFDNLKFRVGYGKSGNRTVGRYQTLARVGTGFVYNFNDVSAFGQSVSSLANNDLGWETTTGLNLGLDFEVLKGRISGQFDYYRDNTEDILFNLNLPVITGFGSILSNIGKVKNKGLELTLNTVNVQSNNFSWKSTFVFARNTNEIVSILGEDKNGDGKEDDIIANSLFIGRGIGAIYNFATDGIYQLGAQIPAGYRPGNYIVRDISGPDGVPDGKISSTYDRSILGFTEPAYRFSFYNLLNYKELSFSFFINSIQGGNNGFYGNITPSSDGAWDGGNTQGLNIVKEWDYWTPRNPNARFQRLTPNGAIPPNQYQQRNFIRLQDVTLAYNLNSKVVQKLGIKNAQINLAGKNLITSTNWVGTDPELGLGINAGHLPLQRSFSMGLNVTF